MTCVEVSVVGWLLETGRHTEEVGAIQEWSHAQIKGTRSVRSDQGLCKLRVFQLGLKDVDFWDARLFDFVVSLAIACLNLFFLHSNWAITLKLG